MTKRFISIAMVFVMVFALAACSKDEPKQTESINTQPTETKSVETNTTVPSEKEDTLSGKLEVWSSGEELQRFVEGFNELYPEVEVNITVVPNSDFIAKLTPTIAGGQGAPDIFTGESDYVKYLVESGYWDDLRGDPYNADTSDVWDYIVDVGTDKNGTLRALSWQASPGSFMYRRDMAKEVLDVEQPEDVAALLTDDASMLDVAAKLKEHDIKMFASWQDIFNMKFSDRKTPWVVDDKLVIDESLYAFMDTAKTIVEKGYDLGVDPWAPEWTTAVESDDTFCYVLPSWGYQFVVKPSANTTKGLWAMCQGSVPYVKGGTWLGIYKDSPNKDLAWAFLSYCCLNAEVQQQYAATYGEYVSSKSADAVLAEGVGEDVLGGQNHFAFYNDQMAKLPADLMTPYDGTINNAFLSAVKNYATGVMTKDDAVQQFKEDVATAYPELTIE